MRILKKITTIALSAALILTSGIPNVNAAPTKGSITIHKFAQEELNTNAPNGTGEEIEDTSSLGKPLSGVTFDIYKVADDETSTETPQTGKIDSKTTDSNGEITFTNLDLGRYLIVESKAPSNVISKSENFLVNVPTTVTTETNGESVNNTIYDIHVYPKNLYGSGAVKLIKVNQDNDLLAGAEFKLYKKNIDGTYTAYNDTTYTTSSNGELKGTIAIDGLPFGNYAFIETKAPSGYTLDPTPNDFTIDKNGSITINANKYVTSGDVELVKVTNYSTPVIHKGVKSVANQDAGYDIDKDITWVINPIVPSNIDTYSKFVIKDNVKEIDQRLYNIHNVKVLVSDNDLSSTKLDGSDLSQYGTILTENTDYNISINDNKTEFSVSFVDLANKINHSELIKGKFVYIVFNTNFDIQANDVNDILGEAIKNQAHLEYNNNFMYDGKDKGPLYKKDSDGNITKNPDIPDEKIQNETLDTETPEVHTGGVALYKYTMYNGNKEKLANAEFKIAATKEDAQSGRWLTDKEGNELVVKSNEEGIAIFKGLSYGEDGVTNDTAATTYYIVETKAPTGYNKLTDPITVTINKDSHKYDTIPTRYQIENKAGVKLPITGGIGTIIFTATGLSLMGIAVLLYKKSSKKK